MKSFLDRFWEKVNTSGSCWIWTSATWGSGYGFFWTGGKLRSQFAHRISWELANAKEIPEGLCVMHSCDNKLCVNPAHLSLGTNKENTEDSMRKGRRAIGMRNGGGKKLHDDDVRIIRAQKGFASSGKLSAAFDVSRSVIKAIWRNKIWKHVQLAETEMSRPFSGYAEQYCADAWFAARERMLTPKE